MKFKTKLMALLRKVGAAPAADFVHYLAKRVLNSGRNRRFRRHHRDVPLPPAYLVYESFQMDFSKYYLGGKETARWVVGLLEPFITRSGMRILDWGCGPARVIRHLPDIRGKGYYYHGCDYNKRTIAWCTKNIPGISFSLNGIHPPLPYNAESFDAIYGISIFTHLAEDNHKRWAHELYRVLAKDGTLLLTLHGKAFCDKLTHAEQRMFDNGNLVVRGRAKEGQRMYGAFHPPVFVERLFHSAGFSVVTHIPGTKRKDYIAQDVWIFRKATIPANN